MRERDRCLNVRKLGQAPLCGVTVVVTEKTADTLASPNWTGDTLSWRSIDELVAQPLVVSFAMVMRHEIGERGPQMTFTQRNHAIEAFFSERANDPFRVCIAIGRQEWRSNHPDASRREETLDGRAPFPITITDQQAILAKPAIHLVSQLAHRLDAERNCFHEHSALAWTSLSSPDPDSAQTVAARSVLARRAERHERAG